MKYLVSGFDGPGFATARRHFISWRTLCFRASMRSRGSKPRKRILAGGLKVGARAFVFIAEAESNEKLDRMLREIPFWGMLKWEVTPLESFETRAEEERVMTSRLRKAKK